MAGAAVGGGQARPGSEEGAAARPARLTGRRLLRRLLARTGSGRALGAEQRLPLERRLQTPLARVRVHRGEAVDEAARSLGARAFALGRHVFLSRSEPARSRRAWATLAHELVHVRQHLRRAEPEAGPIQEAPEPEVERVDLARELASFHRVGAPALGLQLAAAPPPRPAARTDLAPPEAPAAPGTEGPDLEALSQEVYARIRRRLAVERERIWGL